MSDKSADKMNSGNVFVSNATEWANALIRLESKGPGDYENSGRRLEARYGIAANIFWRLRHGRIKDITCTIYTRLQAAYLAECERQTRILKAQAEIAKAKGLAGPVLDTIEALDDDEVA